METAAVHIKRKSCSLAAGANPLFPSITLKNIIPEVRVQDRHTQHDGRKLTMYTDSAAHCAMTTHSKYRRSNSLSSPRELYKVSFQERINRTEIWSQISKRTTNRGLQDNRHFLERAHVWESRQMFFKRYETRSNHGHQMASFSAYLFGGG